MSSKRVTMRTEKEIRERIAYYEDSYESMKESGKDCDYLLERICELYWVLGEDYFGRDD